MQQQTLHIADAKLIKVADERFTKGFYLVELTHYTHIKLTCNKV
jgi:hypothetical protein